MAKPGPRTTPRYSREFKATAVRLSLMPGVALHLKIEHDLLKKAIAFTSERNATSLPSSTASRKPTR